MFLGCLSVRLSSLSVPAPVKFVNTISSKPLGGISPNIYNIFGAVVDRDKLIRF